MCHRSKRILYWILCCHAMIYVIQGGGIQTITVCSNMAFELRCSFDGQVLVLYRAELMREDLTTCVPEPTTTPPPQQTTEPGAITTQPFSTSQKYSTSSTIDTFDVAAIDDNEYVTEIVNVTEYVTDVFGATTTNQAIEEIFTETYTEGYTTGYTSSGSTSVIAEDHYSTAEPVASRLTDDRGETPVMCSPESIYEEINAECFGRRQCVVYVNETVIRSTLCLDDNPYIVIDYICVQEENVHSLCSGRYDYQTIEQDWGYITTPGYPIHYETQLECTIDIITQKPNVTGIELTFIDMKLKPCFQPKRCCMDFIRLESETWRSWQICRDMSNPVISVTDDAIQVAFQSGVWRGSRGVLIEYKVLPFEGYPEDPTTIAPVLTTEALHVSTEAPLTTSAPPGIIIPEKTTTTTTSTNPRKTTKRVTTTATLTTPEVTENDTNTAMVAGLLVGFVALILLSILVFCILRKTQHRRPVMKGGYGTDIALGKMPPMQRVAMEEELDQKHLSKGGFAVNPNWTYQEKWQLSDPSSLVTANGTVHSSIEDMDHYENDEESDVGNPDDINYGLEPLDFEYDDPQFVRNMKDVGYVDVQNTLYEDPSAIDRDPAFVNHMKDVGYIEVQNSIYKSSMKNRGSQKKDPVFVVDHSKAFDDVDAADISDSEEIHVQEPEIAYVHVHQTLKPEPPKTASKT